MPNAYVSDTVVRSQAESAPVVRKVQSFFFTCFPRCGWRGSRKVAGEADMGEDRVTGCGRWMASGKQGRHGRRPRQSVEGG